LRCLRLDTIPRFSSATWSAVHADEPSELVHRKSVIEAEAIGSDTPLKFTPPSLTAPPLPPLAALAP
jgi:hypothetical protein